MNTFEQAIASVSPFPFSSNGRLFDGRDRAQPKFCRDKCESKECLAFVGRESTHVVCKHGFSCYPVTLGQSPLVVNGIIVPEKNAHVSSERKKALRQNVVRESDVVVGIEKLRQGHSVFLAASNDGAKDSVALFHDIRTSVSVVLSWCQNIIAAAPGKTFEQKLAEADQNTRNLFSSINLLQEQLELADVFANPSAITYGRQHPSSLTGFWYRMVKLFEPRAWAQKGSIKFIGNGRDVAVKGYKSMQFLPLILLDNAVKYSHRGKAIDVEFRLEPKALEIVVSSYGDIVPTEFHEQIFEKNIRGPNGISANPEGMGMGLFIARKIATAHGFSLSYRPPLPPASLVGNNEFVLTIPRDLVTVDGR